MLSKRLAKLREPSFAKVIKLSLDFGSCVVLPTQIHVGK